MGELPEQAERRDLLRLEHLPEGLYRRARHVGCRQPFDPLCGRPIGEDALKLSFQRSASRTRSLFVAKRGSSSSRWRPSDVH